MAARPRSCCLVVLAGLAVLTAGCGAQGPDYQLKTPPAKVAAPPIQTPDPPASQRNKAKGPKPTQRQAERLRPVLAGWAAALRRGDPDRAARYFAVPAIVAQSMTVELETREQVRRFNDELPCGARLLEVQHDGRYVVGTFRLTRRSGHDCTAAGELTRVAFVIRARHFTEWRQVPDRPGAPPGPDKPEDAPSATEPAAA
jgi:predicted small lipoprotein YifL/ketosteroid isomerase-like protein